jgi:hypothetical protein
MHPSSRLRYLLIVLFGVGVLLSGCTQLADPTTGDGTSTVSGTSTNPFDVPVAGLSLLLLNPAVVGGDRSSEDDSETVREQVYALIGLTSIAEDGSFELSLPEPPASFLTPIDQALVNAAFVVGCVVDVSDSSVKATVVILNEEIALPNVVGLTYLGATFGLALDTDIELDFDLDAALLTQIGDARVLSWIYADGATNVVTDAETCASDRFVIEVDLALREGWNQVGFSVVMGDPGTPTVLTTTPTVISLTGAADAPVYLTLLGSPVFDAR